MICLPSFGFYNWPNLYPVYLRGEAYLALHRGGETAKEFQKTPIIAGSC